MTSPPEQVTIRCPACGLLYQDWHRASLNLDLDHFDEKYVEEATTATCPACRTRVELAALVVRHGIWTLRF